MILRALLVTVLLAETTDAKAQDIAKHFEGIQGTFVLLNDQTGQYIRHDAGRAARRFPPCSTFKVPNTAILLETAAVTDPEQVLKYDPALKQGSFWAHDQSLRSAFKVSALWYYQVLSRQIGLEAEDRYVKQFRYGNADTSGGMETMNSPFWVDGSLRISANQQVEFLRRFYEGGLGLSDRTTRLTKEIMVSDETPRWRLSAKTGACRPTGEDATVWYVGYVERSKDVYYFALQLGDKEFGDLLNQRVNKARAILTDLGILD